MSLMVRKIKNLPIIWYLAIVSVIGLALRLANITKSSIWHDEGYSAMLISEPVMDIIARTARDVHPPLYYIAQHYWSGLFGVSELGLRSFSVAVGILTIPAVYFLAKRLFAHESLARTAALFTACAPFLVRYSQEARMYALVALLLILATYCLVRALQDRTAGWWVAYSALIAASLYTHYYTVFIIAAHWLYMMAQTRKGEGLRLKPWWLANLGAVALFAIWLPAAYAQFTRVQAAFWIPPVNILTLPNTLMQFLTFSDSLAGIYKIGLGVIAAGLMAGLVIWARRYRAGVLLLTLYTLAAPIAVFLLSFARPIYIDRYFVFSAVGFYILLAAIIYLLRPFSSHRYLRIAVIIGLLAVFAHGLSNVYAQANHQMRAVAAEISSRYQPGDEIVSGELYTYFDFSYYNHTGQELRLLAPGGVSGYGESSLFYERADEIVVRDLSHLNPRSGYVWVVGKTGQHDYFDKVPANWQPDGPKYMAGYSAAQRYRINR